MAAFEARLVAFDARMAAGPLLVVALRPYPDFDDAETPGPLPVLFPPAHAVAVPQVTIENIAAAALPSNAASMLIAKIGTVIPAASKRGFMCFSPVSLVDVGRIATRRPASVQNEPKASRGARLLDSLSTVGPLHHAANGSSVVTPPGSARTAAEKPGHALGAASPVRPAYNSANVPALPSPTSPRAIAESVCPRPLSHETKAMPQPVLSGF